MGECGWRTELVQCAFSSPIPVRPADRQSLSCMTAATTSCTGLRSLLSAVGGNVGRASTSGSLHSSCWRLRTGPGDKSRGPHSAKGAPVASWGRTFDVGRTSWCWHFVARGTPAITPASQTVHRLIGPDQYALTVLGLLAYAAPNASASWPHGGQREVFGSHDLQRDSIDRPLLSVRRNRLTSPSRHLS